MLFRPQKKDSYLADINITPFVDVLLVLLVLFIVTLPVVIDNLAVNLPQTTETKQTPPTEPVYIVVNKEGVINYRQKSITLDNLIEELLLLKETNPTIVIQADQDNEYGIIVQVLARLQSEGFEKVGLSVEIIK